MAKRVSICLENDSLPAPAKSVFPDRPEEWAPDWLDALNATGLAIANMVAGQAGHMICVASFGITAPPVGTLLNVNSGISGRCVRERRSLCSYDTTLDPRVDQDACETLGIRSLAIAPLYRQSRCIGILEAFSDKPGAFSAETLPVIENYAALAEALSEVETEPSELELPEPWNAPISFAKDVDSPLSEMRVEEAGAKAAGESSRAAVVGASVNDLAVAIPPSLLTPDSGSSPRRLRWFAVAAVIAGLGFSAPRLFHRVVRRAPLTSGNVQHSEMGESVTAGVAQAPENQTLAAAAPKIENNKDPASELNALVKRAESGNAASQDSLAHRYERGDGVRPDKLKATAWYIVAGASGNQAAKSRAVKITHELSSSEIAQVRFNVGKMFVDGIGVSRNPVAAYFWFTLAGAAGDNRAKAEQLKLQETMSSPELSEARQRAEQWLSSHTLQRSAIHLEAH